VNKKNMCIYIYMLTSTLLFVFTLSSRPAVFPPQLPRVLALNGDSSNWGSWFTDNGEKGIAEVLNNLKDLRQASSVVCRLTADAQAACRRVCIAICTDELITEGAKTNLRTHAKAKALAGVARRKSLESVST
jgi:hypothetical protein